MKQNIFAIMSIIMFGAPLFASAAPIQYELTYTAAQGPDGTGSFFFDAAIGEITGFTWDFGGVVGGVADGTYGTANEFGDTFGRLVFEILSQTNAHSGADCILGACSEADPLIGNGPLDATTFVLSSGGNQGPTYAFETEDGFVAQGKIALIAPQATVPEPGTGSLIVGALLVLFAIRRRLKA